MHNRILCVDDEPNVLAGYQRNLRKQFSLDTATSGAQALALMDQQSPYAVIVADMQMPGMNGVEFLAQAEKQSPDTVRLMLTGNADQRTAVDAVNRGHIFRFLNKPCPPEVLAVALEAALQQHRLITAERELLENTLNGSVKLLTDILSMMDPDSFGRAQRLREAMKTFLHGRPGTQTWDLELAAMLSPIGYVAIPPLLLAKTRSGGGLSGPELDILARVPETGANLLANIPRLETVAEIVRYQNKNFDGTGFPVNAIAGEEIPIGARILKVLIDLQIILDRRLPHGEAYQKLKACPSRYDPKILEAVAAAFDLYCPPPVSESKSKKVRVRDLQIGHVLQGDLRSLDDNLILAAGNRLSPMILERIRNFAQLTGVKEPIYILEGGS